MTHPSKIHDSSNRRIGEALRTHRLVLAEALIESVRNWQKYARELSGTDEDRRAFVGRELIAFIDYLELFFKSGDADYRNLYVGEKMKQCYDARDTHEQTRERCSQITASDRRVLIQGLAAVLESADLDRFANTLDSIHGVLNASGARSARVLFVGDCLHVDILSFLAGPVLEQGTVLIPTFATSKNPAQLLSTIRDLQSRTFDLIFYSPFSYAFQLDYSQFQFLRAAGIGRQQLKAVADSGIAETRKTLELLDVSFEAPVFVHNSANVRRHDNSIGELLKNVLTRRSRRASREIVNAWIAPFLEELNAKSFRHFFLIDEAALLGSFSERSLGLYFYNSEMQHPAVLGKALAPLYETAILAWTRLAKKKVIVCDLDNTLWAGVIGEGAVTHYLDRQRILRDLRTKGFLLAINSKNDPKNVQWTGAVLGPDDFVSSQINWRSKAENLKNIAKELNLNTRDFLFIDDRADERAMVQEFLPEVVTLDAESPEIWRQLALVAHMLPEQSETDRTLAYKQREQRESFLNLQNDTEFEREELFHKLDLSLSIRPARFKELKRVTELINRTNQFNMQGSRTTIKEITGWHENPAYAVLVAEASDRFGAMGVISVIVLALGREAIEIPVFVLSCRVFGYGVETAILNFVKSVARDCNDGAGKPVTGYLTWTQSNEPCRLVYAENGFSQQGERWTFRDGAAIPDPAWLRITTVQPGSLAQAAAAVSG
jgi:FkbH-like protein